MGIAGGIIGLFLVPLFWIVIGLMLIYKYHGDKAMIIAMGIATCGYLAYIIHIMMVAKEHSLF